MEIVRHFKFLKRANFHFSRVVWASGLVERHFGLVARMRGTTHDMPLLVFTSVQKFVRIGSVVLIISKFNNFCDLAENCLFTSLWGGFGDLRGTTPFDELKMLKNSSRTQLKTSSETASA